MLLLGHFGRMAGSGTGQGGPGVCHSDLPGRTTGAGVDNCQGSLSGWLELEWAGEASGCVPPGLS